MSLKPNGYLPRLMEAPLSAYLGMYGGVEIRGPRWCGKTWLSLTFAESVIHLDRNAERAPVELQPSIALAGEKPHLIDEWQEIPAVWDEVRGAIDASGSIPGQYLLTGSSTPHKDEVVHSGTGRIALLDMGPMTLYEQGLSNGRASLEALFLEHEKTLEVASAKVDIREIAALVCRGGWPAVVARANQSPSLVAAQYIETTCEAAYRKEGLDPAAVQRALVALARNDGTPAALRTLESDFAGGQMPGPGGSSFERCYSYIRQSYLVRELTGWDAPVKSRARVRTKPKRYIVDPSLTAALLGYDADRLLADRQMFGILFESLCMRDLSCYLASSTTLLGPRLHYYRDDYGLEIDAIIELLGGRWAAVEIKLDVAKADEAASNLLRLKDKVASNPAAQTRPPSFLAVLTANSPFFYQRPDGVYVIPITCLGR